MSPSKNKSPLVWVEVDLAALRQNLRVLRSSLPDSSVGVLAIVKADAYGHGMSAISKALWAEGVRFFGVANAEEALLLRKVLPKARILAFGPFHPSQLSFYIAQKITPTLSSLEDALLLSRALKGKKVFSVHVKIDTGMGRLGLSCSDVSSFFRRMRSMPKIDIEGVYTHFSSADDENTEPTKIQLELFAQNLKKIHSLGFTPRLIHASNSMGALRFPEAHFNLIRPGLLLYGLKSSPRVRLPAGMRPVMSWKTKVSFLKKFVAGQTVSYGRTFKVKKNTLIAALPVGYSHGYRVVFSNKSCVLVRGHRCPIAGRVTMDQILVDVGHVSGVRRWEEAVLIGRQGQERVTAEELADLAETIPYEIVCAVHSRVPRIYLKS